MADSSARTVVRSAVVGQHSLGEFEVQLLDGSPVAVTATRTIPGTFYEVEVAAEVGTEVQARYNIEQSEMASPMSDWSDPGHVVVPEPGLVVSLVVGAIVLRLLQRRGTT